jgi:hypothetical protein
MIYRLVHQEEKYNAFDASAVANEHQDDNDDKDCLKRGSGWGQNVVGSDNRKIVCVERRLRVFFNKAKEDEGTKFILNKPFQFH